MLSKGVKFKFFKNFLAALVTKANGTLPNSHDNKREKGKEKAMLRESSIVYPRES